MRKVGITLLTSAVASLVLFNSQAGAVQNISTISATETQKKYQRKAVMGVDIGLPKRDLPVAVEYCDQKCSPKGIWHYQITPQIEEHVAKEIYDWLITQRFDKVIISPSNAIIITAGSKQEINVPSGKFLNLIQVLWKILRTL